jgi:hypothetical protein
MDED